MQEVKLDFQHGRLIFRLDDLNDKEFFISSKAILQLLDRQRVSEIFHSLDPAVKYANFERFDFLVELELLKQKGLSMTEIAAHFDVDEEELKKWMTERAGVIERIKNQNPSNFAAAVRGLAERLIIKKRG